MWKHTTGKNGNLEKHSKSISHKQAMVAWSDYVKNNNERATIAERLDKLRSTQIERNRHYISSVAELILLFARQTIPLRGYGDESSSSMNRGNFLELMHFISSMIVLFKTIYVVRVLTIHITKYAKLNSKNTC